MKGFDEAWLAAHQAKSKPVKRFKVQPIVACLIDPVAPSSPPPIAPNEICFRLIAPLPLLNVWERMHWTMRKNFKRSLAAEIFAELGGQCFPVPMARAKVTIWRHSIRAPDADNLISKALLDVLQPISNRHPYGLGIIAGDDPDHLISTIAHVDTARRADQCTRVLIQNMEFIQ